MRRRCKPAANCRGCTCGDPLPDRAAPAAADPAAACATHPPVACGVQRTDQHGPARDDGLRHRPQASRSPAPAAPAPAAEPSAPGAAGVPASCDGPDAPAPAGMQKVPNGWCLSPAAAEADALPGLLRRALHPSIAGRQRHPPPQRRPPHLGQASGAEAPRSSAADHPARDCGAPSTDAGTNPRNDRARPCGDNAASSAAAGR